MMAQLEPYIEFHSDYIQEQYKATHIYYEQSNQDPRPWSFGEIYNSMKGLFSIGGRITRTPGNYTRVDPYTGRPTRKPLRDTNEYVHPSVRTRSYLDGPGPEDRGYYESKALEGYKLRMTGHRPEENMPLAVWESRAKRKGVPRRTLRECPLFDTERKLLRYSQQVEQFVYAPPEQRPNR
jgi:hypothetical protein